MKKTIMGALCAIALSIGMTSCSDPDYVAFSDVKEVCITYDDYGCVTAYYAIISVEGVDDVYTIDNTTYRLLTDTNRKPSDTLRFECKYGIYRASISRAHTETITLN